MSKHLFLPIILIFSLIPLQANGPLKKETAEFFIEHLIADSSVQEFVSLTTTLHSSRLGISYTGVPNKFLIQNDIDDEIKAEVRSGLTNYDIEIIALDDYFSQLTFNVPAEDYQCEFFFKNDKLVSRTSYYTRNWARYQSRFFRYLISKPADFNTYAVDKLDSFVVKTAELLQIEAEDLERLEKEKIDYVLCTSTDEIEQISGYGVRGIYVLAYDQIISTYNSHPHEVAHLLMNFKLRRMPLYTHPFFQEGFASAVGGRGGKAVDVISSLGSFLQTSGFMRYSEILTAQDFRQNDPSLTYPVSAIYNRFLLETMPLEQYLRLYRDYSGSMSQMAQIAIPHSVLPDSTALYSYIEHHFGHIQVSFDGFDVAADPILDAHWGKVWEDEQEYHFQLRGSIRLLPKESPPDFQSQEFVEIFPDVLYAGEKYFLDVSAEEVKLFNFYTATLVAFFSNGLTTSPQQIWHDDGYYEFSIAKSVFDNPITEYQFAQ